MAAKSSRNASGRREGRAPRDGPAKPKVSAYDAGIRLLATRPYGGVELGRRLLRRGYGDDEVRSALDTFGELGYVDDATFADLYVTHRAGRRGPRALAAELAAKGVDREIVQAAVGRFDGEAQVGMAARLVRRHIGSNLPPTYKQLLATEGARLLRRGYSRSIASAACRAVWMGTEDLLPGA